MYVCMLGYPNIVLDIENIQVFITVTKIRFSSAPSGTSPALWTKSDIFTCCM